MPSDSTWKRRNQHSPRSNITVRVIPKNEPDVGLYVKALIELAREQLAQEADHARLPEMINPIKAKR
jgi:hypothetical protein